ncbi:iron chelate uptake ABC transporter family permease subunit [Cronobacter sakazakii]
MARTQVLGLVAITLLCASATAVVGPIAFIGVWEPTRRRRSAAAWRARRC